MAAAGEPEVIRDKAAMRAWSRRRRAEGRTVVLVPTMGFLHEGHLSLVSAAAAAATAGPVAVVVSIYVNPSQFAPTEDLATYPSDLAGDLRKLASTGAVHAVFNPPDLYVRGAPGRTAVGASGTAAVSCLDAAGAGDGHETWIRVERLEKGLCGSSRPSSSVELPPWWPSCSTSSSSTSPCSGKRITSSGDSSAEW
jgi:pantoate--beta-alanine ligase